MQIYNDQIGTRVLPFAKNDFLSGNKIKNLLRHKIKPTLDDSQGCKVSACTLFENLKTT